MKSNSIRENIVREAAIYEHYTGTKPQQVHLSSGLYFLYWSKYTEDLLCIMDVIEDEIALSYSRNDS